MAFATTEKPWARWAEDEIWLSQLQYQKNIFNNWFSGADSGFFVSPVGKINPAAELQADYELFLNAPEKPWGYANQPVICAFPTRRKFLEEKLNIKFKSNTCTERDQWMKAFTGSQLYLVFSDAFPDNPASMFGHTFLLFSKNSPLDSAKGLLDYSVNFSADTASTSEKSLLYSLKGLFGYFPGRYRIYKFYQMANMYANFDSRDIWYLRIPFGDEKLQRFLDHIWEIFTTTSFDYYFFDQNCSYRLMAAFDYADPSLHLMNEFHSRFPIYYVAPLSTFRSVANRFEATELQYTPSIWKRLRKKVDSLTKQQHENFLELKKDLSGLQKESDIETLDALALYYDYKKRTSSENGLSDETLDHLRNILVHRSEIETPSLPELKIKPLSTPLQSHLNKAAWFGVGQQKLDSLTNPYGIFGMRALYHDLLNPAAGYDSWSDLTVLDTEIHFQDQKTKINFFKIVNIRSLFPAEAYEMKTSWMTDGGYDSTFKYYFRGGAGYAIQNKNENLLAYFYLTPLLSTNEFITLGKGYALLTEIGTIYDWSKAGRIWLYGIKNLEAGNRTANEIADALVLQGSYYLNTNHELRLKWTEKKNQQTVGVNFHFQF